MEQIANEPLLLDNDEEGRKYKKGSIAKKYLLMGICVAIGLVIGILIGYFSFKSSDKESKNEKVLQSAYDMDAYKHEKNITVKPKMSQALINMLPMVFEIISELGSEAIEILSSSTVSYSQPEGNDYWITYLDGTWGTYDGKVISMYYHPTRKHTATTRGKLDMKRSVANGGHWAISHQTRDLWHNKAYYGFL